VLEAADAFGCFIGSEIDVLAVGNCRVRRRGSTTRSDRTGLIWGAQSLGNGCFMNAFPGIGMRAGPPVGQGS
jgi:hypothetical protein